MNRFYIPTLSLWGGSIAKGTALKKHSDLDCVMVMKKIKNADQLSRKLPFILTDLESRLKRSWKGDPWKLKSIKKSTYLVQFKMSRYSEDVKVDLLPRFEANVGTDTGTYLITSG